MTNRERMLLGLSGGQPDRIAWAPNFDWWLGVNTRMDALPEGLKGLSRNDIVRKVGAAIWARAGAISSKGSEEIKTEKHTEGDKTYTTYETPVGTVSIMQQVANEWTRAVFLKEHMVKRVEDLKVIRFMVENTTYYPTYENFVKADEDVGDDGIALYSGAPSVPMIQLMKTYIGWVDGLYMLHDHTKEMEKTADVMTQKAIEAYQLLADSPAQVLECGDNLDERTFSPRLFERYGLPYYRQMSAILHAKGKTYKSHACGWIKHLLPMIKDSGLDAVEAFAISPMNDLTTKEAREILDGQVSIMSGIPSVIMSHMNMNDEDFREYVLRLLDDIQPGDGFVLGMADNVPANADFERVSMISQIVDEYYGFQ
ncbi:uroporphyrinogen decarboxylase family protein [Candidatus Poribacteria bacterium]